MKKPQDQGTWQGKKGIIKRRLWGKQGRGAGQRHRRCKGWGREGGRVAGREAGWRAAGFVWAQPGLVVNTS